MIVLPLFADQHDNAQRVQDVGLGCRLDTYYCTKEEILSAIEKLLNNAELAKRLGKIRERIQSSVSRQRAVEAIEEIARNK